jgi:hypothetical protein
MEKIRSLKYAENERFNSKRILRSYFFEKKTLACIRTTLRYTPKEQAINAMNSGVDALNDAMQSNGTRHITA